MSSTPNNNSNKPSQSVSGWASWLLYNPIMDLLRLAIRPQTIQADSSTAVWIRRHPSISLVGLAYALTWLGLIPLIIDPTITLHPDFNHLSRPLIVYAFLGVLGCFWAAIIVASAVGGIKGRYDLLRGYLKWQIGIQWYLVVLLCPLMVSAIAIGVYFLLTARLPVVPALQVAPAIFATSFIAFTARYMIGNFEEICWRASLLPRLQAKYSALVASLIVGLVQGLWHLPFIFVSGHYVQVIGLPAFMIQTIAMGLVLTWVYNNTRGNLLMVALFHAAYDSLSQYQGTDVTLFYLTIGIWCIIAVFLVIIFGAKHLSRKPESELAYTIIKT